MAQKTYAQLGTSADVQGGDLIATWRSTGPLKTVTANILATFLAGASALTSVFAQRANNLSDLASASTARTNLGLGSAALLTAGTAANNAVQLDGSGNLPALPGGALTDVTKPWTQIATATPSGTSTAFTGISTTYRDLLLIFENVTFSLSSAVTQFALGDATPTYATAATITGTGAAQTVSGMVLINNCTNDFGSALAFGDQLVLASSPLMAATTAYAFDWRITGGVRAIKVLNSSSFTGGTLRLMGR